MSHEVQKMAYVGQVPWHGLGNKMAAGSSIQDWTEAAGFTWEAVKSPVVYSTPSGDLVMPSRHVLHRSDTGHPLAVCSDRYKPVQPAEVMDFFATVVEGLPSFSLETAGVLREGKKLWALAKSDNTLDFSQDNISRYLLLATSYDLTIPTLIQQTSVRVVCNNTLQFAFDRKGEVRTRVSHATTFDKDQIINDLALDDDWGMFSDLVANTAAKGITDNQAKEFFEEVFFPSSVLSTDSSKKKRLAAASEAYKSSPGADLASAKGTLWGALNAVTYMADHTGRSKNVEMKLESGWFGESSSIKSRALATASAMV